MSKINFQIFVRHSKQYPFDSPLLKPHQPLATRFPVNISVEEINDTRKSVRVNIPVDVIDQEEKSLIGDFVKQAQIPGFRAGKAPLNLIKQRFKKQIEEELNRKLTQKAYQRALEESKLSVYSVIDIDGDEFSAGEAGELKFTFDVNPEFELPDYLGIEVAVASNEPTVNEIEEAKKQIIEQRAEYNETDAAAEPGDYVKLSYEGKIGEESVAELVTDHPMYGKQATTWEQAGAAPTEDEIRGIPAIVEGIVGMKRGEQADFEESFAADFHIEPLQGKTVTYHTAVLEVRKKILPEVNDEFFKALEVESEAEWIERITNELTKQKEREVYQEKRKQLVDKIDAQVDFPLPESAVDNERDIMLRGYIETAIRHGSTEEQLEADKEVLHKSADEAAQRQVKMRIILEKIAVKEGIEVKNEDMSPMIMQEAMMNRIKPEQVVKDLQNNREKLHQMQRQVLFNKTLAFLIEKAKVIIQ